MQAMIIGQFLAYFSKKHVKENFPDLHMHVMNSSIDSIYVPLSP